MFYLARTGRRAVVVTASAKNMAALAERLQTWLPAARILQLPPLDGSPFSFSAVHPTTRRTRLLTLDALLLDEWDYLITTPQTFLEPLPTAENLVKPRLSLVAGDHYDIDQVARDLVAMGYLSVDIVAQPGDFARRGGIIDIYSFAEDKAWRLDFFDDELEEIRLIDPNRQRSISNADRCDILPLFEWAINDKQQEIFARKGGDLWNKTEARSHFLELVAQIRDRGRFPGYLHWTSLFFTRTCHFYDLIQGETLCYIDDWEEVQDTQERFLTQVRLQADAMSDKQLHVPTHTLYGLDDLERFKLPEHFSVIRHHQLKLDKVDQDFVTQTVPHYQNDVGRFLDHWKSQVKRLAIVLVSHNSAVLHRIRESLEDYGLMVRNLELPLTTMPGPGFYMIAGHLDTGFSWPDHNLTVFSERDIWSKTATIKRPGRSDGKKIFQAEFRDLKIGDYVVHLDHGIGRFLGLVELEAGGESLEMMAIEYRDNQKLYVNLNQLDLIQRYGSENTTVHLDKMGGTSWAKARARVKKAVRQMAEELLRLYAQRKLVTGHSYGPDTEWQAEFEDQFEHEPTDGQLGAVADIKRDLGKPMDRLLVGDVGFGKTEVAMRTAFKAVMEGYQVAILCPTTVLAFQHYHTFKNRFAGFPVKIDWISRFSTTVHTRKVLADTAAGAVDIVVGTHRLLSKDIVFKNLSLVVVDEEQRFGVAHKERLKHMRKQVDVLSMTATPIPRTLHMSLTGIRDISVIESPPLNRLAINTMVVETRDDLIKNAIEFELERGGQAYFVHNRVETMEAAAANLKILVPQARIRIAHGQMDSKQIEEVMLAFMEHKVDILVASTIIENGVDIPNANTMIVNRADRFGMSQLYQLRGRIGRADRPAYAYLLVPPRARMSAIARKRLATLEEFSDLGSGFRIAAMDMELRGAGSILGGEQAGHINTIGFEMYQKLLEEAVHELDGTPVQDQIHCSVKLGFGAAIPPTYIEETNQRLSYYKRLAGARSEDDLHISRETMIDCYGPLPERAESLVSEHRLRLFLASHKVLLAERDRDRLRIRFHESAEVNSEVVLGWLQQKKPVSIAPDGLLTLVLPSQKADEVYNFIRETVLALTK